MPARATSMARRGSLWPCSWWSSHGSPSASSHRACGTSRQRGDRYGAGLPCHALCQRACASGVGAGDRVLQLLYLRSRFEHIRVIVPHLAMSAATMIACAADEIVMGKHSFVGPTDPQLLLATQLGIRPVPAQAVLDQFDRAQRESKDPTKYAAWVPMLSTVLTSSRKRRRPWNYRGLW